MNRQDSARRFYNAAVDDYSLLIDLHLEGQRQGPGSDAATELAVQLAGLDRTRPLAIADIGAGTGASGLLLARLLHARITAVDLMPEFLDELKRRAASLLAGRLLPPHAGTLC